jgi:hypothetical protein
MTSSANLTHSTLYANHDKVNQKQVNERNDGDQHELHEEPEDDRPGLLVDGDYQSNYDDHEAKNGKKDKIEGHDVKNQKEKYLAACNKLGIRPNTTLLRKLKNDTLCVNGVIDMSHDFLGDIGTCALIKLLSQIECTKLILRKNGIRNSAIKQLVSALQKHPNLKELDLSENDISLVGAVDLLSLLRANRNIVALTVKGTRIDETNARRIEEQVNKNRKGS